MQAYKKLVSDGIGPGGVKCHCCYPQNDNNHRNARRKLKRAEKRYERTTAMRFELKLAIEG